MHYVEGNLSIFRLAFFGLIFNLLILFELLIKQSVVNYFWIPFTYLLKLICNPQNQ